MKDRLSKLLSVKSLITIAMTACLVALMFVPTNTSEQFVTLFCTSYGMVITYFFTRKDDKGNE